MIKCIAIDKDDYFLHAIQELISHIPALKLISVFRDLQTASTKIKDEKLVPDLVFVDMETVSFMEHAPMPAFPSQTRIILTGNLSATSLTRFDSDIVDQITKPFTLKRTKRAIRKTMLILDQELSYEQPHFTQLLTPGKEDFIFLQRENYILTICLDDICFIEGNDEYITIHSMVGKIIVPEKLSRVRSLLKPYKFTAISPTVIISVKFLEEIDGKVAKIQTHTIPIEQEFESALFSFLQID
ncbi:LytR/AlgR family response regulator transcription factor [Pinibacter aurantiacus]|uniref:LytTR family transcriptional regulator DNA-binding domain-containing protein n=1 Tax=Pinibacter aurantiacus TaxID=2851599 RepID=A0A9E2SAY3_9BACT|nr:LytTR family transcriptional regulator DNA-binding domain-containing protein [Pinibacter aurantiacus]MBV4358812.1 LytTR family transcriptional regulator DNA-binding domain-containing protein [Pinibacter aurantiacus]